jgi:lipopolysaccharide/colanic/teichoic acid biosynthesis glycosyltransferase
MKIRMLHFSILVADLCWIPVAMLLAWALRYGAPWHAFARGNIDTTWPFVVITWILWSLFSSSMKLDGPRDGWWFPAVASRVFLVVCGVMGALLATGYLGRWYISRLALGYFGFSLLVGFLAIRYAASVIIRARYCRGAVRRAMIIGDGRVAREVATKIGRHPEMLCEVVGFLVSEDTPGVDSPSPAALGCGETVSTLGVMDLLVATQVSELILAVTAPFKPELLNLVGKCRELGINVSVVPQPYELYLSRPTLLDLDGVPLLHLQEPSSTRTLTWKRVLDVLLGFPLAVLAAPILLPSAFLLYLRKGRAFRWEMRCGRFGKVFPMLRLNIDRHAMVATRFERGLENLSISELPQLWNVLRGDMSLVGPRPESPDRVKRYSDWQMQRLSVIPGMTGLAQVHGLREQNSSEAKTRFDLQYLLSLSPLSDLSLLLQTLWTLAMRVIRSASASPQQISAPIAPNLDRAIQKLPRLAESQFMKEVWQSAHRSQSSAD